MKLSAPIYQLKRRARLLAGDRHIPLHEALDEVASREGYQRWSLLAAHNQRVPVPEILSTLNEGDTVILGARPGQGKTLLGIRLLLDAIQQGRKGGYFTLESTQKETVNRIRALGGDVGKSEFLPDIITSERICASFIIDYLKDWARGSVVVVDYLQLLDQQRYKPGLSIQLDELKTFANHSGIIIAFISQIDRAYTPECKPVPDILDLRLPNPVDLRVFSKAFFLHAGKLGVKNLA